MEDIGSLMMELIKRCDICIGNKVVSKELLMRTFASFISKTIEKDKHNVGIVLHTGSKCFDAMLLSYAALSNILYNNTDSEELILSLNPGDTVMYKKQRHIFCGFVNQTINLASAEILEEGDYILLQQGNSYTCIARKGWSNITPYMGKSQRMDGRGIRRDNGKRKDFFENVLDIHGSDIPSTIDTSTVIVMSKDESRDLIQGLSFRYGEKSIRYTELVTASYYTENDEYQYGQNPAKVEPVIKITGKISVARKLLLKKEWNRNIGLIVLGEENLRKGQLELPELIERKSIQYVYLCTHVDSDCSRTLLENYPDAELFACTKDFLLDNTKITIEENIYTQQLVDQVDAIIDHEIQAIKQGELVGRDNYRSFKRAMHVIKGTEYDSEEKDDFVIQAFSLMNLFITAPFSMERLENAIISENIVKVKTPSERMKALEESVSQFPEYIADNMQKAVEILNNAYTNVYGSTYKERALQKILRENYKNRVCVVVPKQYYATILKKMHPYAAKTEFTTANKFNNEKLYDLIICVGNFSGKRFDIFRCKSARQLLVILYEEEEYQYRKKTKLAAKIEHNMNIRSTIDVLDETYYEEPETVDDEITEELDLIDAEVNEMLGNAMVRAVRNYTEASGRGGLTEIAAVAKFDSEEVAFFTPNYKAYVLAEEGSSIKETKVADLAEGDTLIFTRSTAKTRDIVDELLQELVESKRISKNLIIAYEMSKEWREILIDYMNENSLTEKLMVKRMIKSGIPVQEMTVRNWLDPDSHTVGPRKMESIEQIGVVTGNRNLQIRARDYFEACRETRRVRRKILDAIGSATLAKITGKELKEDSILLTVNEKLDALSVVLQIEHISFTEETVPVYMTNRPVEVDD